MLAVGISVVEGVLGIFGGGAFAMLCSVLWLLIPVAVLIYMVRPGIRELFGVRINS
jgi:hypothetical protein